MTAVTSFMLSPSICTKLTGDLFAARRGCRVSGGALGTGDAGHGERAAAGTGRGGGVVRALRVLRHVDAVDLRLLLGAEADRLVDRLAEQVGHQAGEDGHREAGQRLASELGQPAAVEQAVR